MRFHLSVTAALALATSAFAQTADFDPVYSPKAGEEVVAGVPFTITWKTPEKYANEQISITLLGGESELKQVPQATIASGISNSAESYAWNVDPTLGSDSVYSLRIEANGKPELVQYSPSFRIKGSAVKPSASSSAFMKIPQGSKTVAVLSTGHPVVSSDEPLITPANYNDTSAYGNHTTLVPVVYTSCRNSILCDNNGTDTGAHGTGVPVVGVSGTWTPPVATGNPSDVPVVTSLGSAPVINIGTFGAVAGLAAIALFL